MTRVCYFIGTSGWSYQGWEDNFYPPYIAEKERLAYYATQFNTVELNSSFYRLPSEKSVKHWFEITPNDFVFSCKASRYLTHLKKLTDYQEGLKKLFSCLEKFQHKLGPLLFQLPPKWRVDLDRLTLFTQALSQEHRYAFEFRDRSWLCEEIFTLLKNLRIAVCFYDYRGFQAPYEVTSDFIYLRLHGPLKTPYQEHYKPAILEQYAKDMADWKHQSMNVFCYFDNDQKVAAPEDAKHLIHLLENR